MALTTEPLSIGENQVINGAPSPASPAVFDPVTNMGLGQGSELAPRPAVATGSDETVLDFGDSKPGKRLLRFMSIILIIILLLAALLAFLNFSGRLPFNPPIKKSVNELNGKVEVINNQLEGINKQITNVSIANPVAGAKGDKGETGTPGLVGPAGAQGPAGSQGIPGTAAFKGDTGATGAMGPQGATGPAGANGVNGTNGTNGTNGADGSMVDLQGAYNNSSTPATITTTAIAKGLKLAAGSSMDSTTLFQVLNSLGGDVLTVDSVNNQILQNGNQVCDSSGNCPDIAGIQYDTLNSGDWLSVETTDRNGQFGIDLSSTASNADFNIASGRDLYLTTAGFLLSNVGVDIVTNVAGASTEIDNFGFNVYGGTNVTLNAEAVDIDADTAGASLHGETGVSISAVTGNIQVSGLGFDLNSFDDINIALTTAGKNLYVRNSAAKQVLAIDTTSNNLVLGDASDVNGGLVFNNSSNANTVTFASGLTASSYSLTLPTVGPSTNQCLQTDTVTASQLKFGDCNNGSVTLQKAYDNSSTPATITTSAAAKDIVFQSGGGNNSTSLFQVKDSIGNQLLTVDTVNDTVNLPQENDSSYGPDLAVGATCSGTNWTDLGGAFYVHTPGSTAALSCTPPATVTPGHEYLISYGTDGVGSVNGSVVPTVGGNYGEYKSPPQLIQAINSNNVKFIPSSDYDGFVQMGQLQDLTRSKPSLVIGTDNGSGTLDFRTNHNGGIFIGGNGNGSSSPLDNSIGAIIIGDYSGISCLDCFQSVTTGSYSMYSTTEAFQALSGGAYSMYDAQNVYQDVALGPYAMYNVNDSFENTAVGAYAIQLGRGGTQNTAIGSYALVNNNGDYNTGLGTDTLFDNTDGEYNTAVGMDSSRYNVTGSYNTSVGNNSLLNNNTGSNNTAVGHDTLINSTGDTNTALGYSAGASLTSGNSNMFLGYNAGYTDGFIPTYFDLDNSTVIGFNAQSTASNSIILGGAGASAVKVGIGTTAPTNTFSVSPDIYDTGTAYQNDSNNPTTTITGVGTTWTANMIGMEFIFSSGEKETITGFIDGTHLDGSVSQLVSGPGYEENYRIHNPAFYVSNTGQVFARASTDTNDTFQVQDAVGNQLISTDSINGTVKIPGGSNTYSPVFGPELLDPGGALTCSGTNWVDNGDGTYTHTPGSTAFLSCTPPASISNGGDYLVKYDDSMAGGYYTGFGNGTVRPNLGAADGVVQSTAFDFGQIIPNGGPFGASPLKFRPSSDYDGTVTPLSLMEVYNYTQPLVVIGSDPYEHTEIRGASNGDIFWGDTKTGGVTDGGDNIGIGNQNMTSCFDCFINVAIGLQAMERTTSSYQEVAIGYEALEYGNNGNNDVAIGQYAMMNSSNTSYNIGIGSYSLQNSQAGFNIGLGISALSSTTIGEYNTAVGSYSQFGDFYDGSTGSYNNSLGANSLSGNVSGNYNVAVGDAAGSSNTTGSNNTFIGANAGASDGTFAASPNLQNATSIGYGSIVQANSNLILGGQGANAVNVGIGTTNATNTFSVSPDIYDTGTAYQSTTTITGVGTTWTANMIGMEFIFNTGEKETITGFTNATHLTGSVSQTVASAGFPAAYRVHNPAFYVTGTGSASLRTSSNTTTAFQVQNAAGTSIFSIDTTNTQIVLGVPSATPVILVLGNKNTAGDPSGTAGATYYNSNANKFRCYENGAWHDCSGGTLGYVEVTADQTAITTEADLTSLTSTVTVPANHRIRITGYGAFTSTTAATSCSLLIKDGSTYLGRAPIDMATGSTQQIARAEAVITPSSGSHTYKLRASCTNSADLKAGAASATANPAYILIEDIGQ